MSTPTPPKKSFADTLIYVVISLSIIALGAGLLLIVFSEDLPLESIFGSGKLEAVNFETLSIEPGKNHYLACPEDYCPAAIPDEITKVYTVSVTVLRDRLISFIDDQPRVDVKTLDLPNLQFDFLAYRGTGPFPDVVTVQLYDLGGNRSSAAIYSRTLKGKDKDGANQARVVRWLGVLETG